MTLEELREKVRKWDLQNNGSTNYPAYYSTILDQLDYHSTKEWRVYLPSEHPDFQSSFMERLASWVSNLDDEDEQKTLLEYALYISFFSHDDFVALYRTAYDREITRWVAEQVGAHLESNGGRAFNELVHKEIHQHTWFCPITDSMDINEFYKVNHLAGIGHRPTFATLQMLSEGAEIVDPNLSSNVNYYMLKPNTNNPHVSSQPLKRLVLLEDIVGSGSQSLQAVRWAVTKLERPVLFIPLILCPNGVEVLRNEEKNSKGHLKVRPVIELRRSDLLGPERRGHSGCKIADAVEHLANKTATQLGISANEAFGFKKTGCSLATFSNTPNNSLPIIWRKPEVGGWNPLFPRIYREK